MPRSFGGISSGWPRSDLARVRRMTSRESAPTATADPITPYMWKLWKRNISWIRNQEMTSALVTMMPNSVPTSTCAHQLSSRV